MVKRLKVIFNPVSGYGLSDKKLEKLIQHFKDHGCHVDLCKTRGKGDAERFAKESDDNISAVVAIGGDGTINEVINGLQGKRIPVGIIPRGTNNLLAKEFGISRNLRKACHVICGNKTKWIDLGFDSKKYFFLMAGVGIDADVVNSVDSSRKGNITVASYGLPIAKVIASYTLPEIAVEVDGHPITRNATSLFVSNVKGYYGPIRFAYLAKTDDGKFDICIMKARRRLDILKYIFGAVTRTLRNFHDVTYVRGEEVKVSSKSAVLYQLDGDPGGSLPAVFSIIPNAVRLLIP